MSGFLAQHASEIAELTLEHLWLTGSAMLLAAAIGVPTGIWLTRHPRWAKPVLGVVNIIQTIPSLALFGFLLPLPWIGDRAARIAIAALTAYALLPIVRNTYAGIEGVDPTVLEVAKALGMTGRAETAQGGASAGRGLHPRRAAHGDRAGGGHCHHRGGGGSRRLGRVHLPRRGFRRQSAGAGRSDPGGPAGDRGRHRAGMGGEPVAGAGPGTHVKYALAPLLPVLCCWPLPPALRRVRIIP